MWISSAFSRHSERYRHIWSVLWGPLGSVLVAFVGIFGAEVLVFFSVVFALWMSGEMSWSQAEMMVDQNMLLLFTYYSGARLLGFGLMYWFVKRYGGDIKALGFRAFRILRAVGVLTISTVGFIVAVIFVMGLLQLFVPGFDVTAEQNIPFLAAQTSMEWVLAFLALVIVAPVAEETIFRGVLLPGIAKLTGVWPAVILVSIAFGVLHPPASSMIMIGIFSVFLCWAYIRTNSLWPPIILHAGKNLIAFLTLVS